MAMTPGDGRFVHVIEIAFELARTGDFKDFASLEREVIAESLEEGLPWIERPGIRRELQTICESKHQADRWHSHTAA
jgi:hypothetical protein